MQKLHVNRAAIKAVASWCSQVLGEVAVTFLANGVSTMTTAKTSARALCGDGGKLHNDLHFRNPKEQWIGLGNCRCEERSRG